MSTEFPKAAINPTQEQKNYNEVIKEIFETIESLEKLGIIPQELKEFLEEQKSSIFFVPQLGPYHKEGPILADHIKLMLEVIKNIERFNFDELNLPGEIKEEAKKIICETCKNKENELKAFAILHDIGKKDCMTAKVGEGRGETEESEFTIEEWLKLLESKGWRVEEAIKDLEEKKFVQINYRKGNKDHGKESEKIIKENLSKEEQEKLELVLKTIGIHEIHFQVFSNNNSARAYKENIIDKGFGKEEEINFLYTACFLDLASSLREDNKRDFTGFVNMVIAKKAYELIEDLKREFGDIKENELNRLLNMKIESIEGFKKEIENVRTKLKLESLELKEEDLEIIKEALSGILNEEEAKQIIKKISSSEDKKWKTIKSMISKELGNRNLGKEIGKVISEIEGQLKSKLEESEKSKSIQENNNV